MPMANFDVRVDLSGNAPLAQGFQSGITTQLPSGYAPFQPDFVSLAQIADIKTARRNQYNYSASGDPLAVAAGFTDARLNVRFVNGDAQWRRDGDMMVYSGGTVQVTMTIRIYADERTRTGSYRRCFTRLYNHELMHVSDEIDIATNWLRSAIEGESYVRGALTVGNRMAVQRFEQDIRPAFTGGGSFLERRVMLLYLDESGRRSAALHARRPRDTQELSDCLAGWRTQQAGG